MLQLAAPSRGLAAPQVEQARAELRAYCHSALKIQTKEHGLQPLSWNYPQTLVMERTERQLADTDRVRIIMLKARQEGISTIVGARTYHGCTLWSGMRGMVLADTLKRAGEIFSIYERFDANLPEGLRPPKVASRRSRELAYSTDSRISVETAGDPDAGRASTIHRLHASEMASWDHAEDTWLSVMQAVPRRGSEVYIESTAQGVGNLFHQLWSSAVAGDSGWLAIFLPWWIHEDYAEQVTDEAREEIAGGSDDFEREALTEGIEWEGRRHVLHPEQLQWRRRAIAENFNGDVRAFRQENPATAEEAFLVTGAPFFDEEALRDHARRTRDPLMRANLIDHEGAVLIRGAERGHLRVFALPADDGHYVIGADTSEGRGITGREPSFGDGERGGSDFSVAEVLEVTTRAQVAELQGRIAPEHFAEQLSLLGRLYSCEIRPNMTGREHALVAVERNHSSGQTVLRWLRDHGYRKLFWHRRMNVRAERPTVEVGWVTDGTTRQPMLDALAHDVREGQIDLASAETVREMTTFVWHETPTAAKPEAQEGCHDDRVMALGIAHEMIRHHSHADPEPLAEQTWTEGPVPEPTPPKSTERTVAPEARWSEGSIPEELD